MLVPNPWPCVVNCLHIESIFMRKSKWENLQKIEVLEDVTHSVAITNTTQGERSSKAGESQTYIGHVHIFLLMKALLMICTAILYCLHMDHGGSFPCLEREISNVSGFLMHNDFNDNLST